jgi:hypothetical protein
MSVQAIEFRSLSGFLRWAGMIDNDAPGLRQQLRVSPAPHAAVLWLSLQGGRHLTEDGRDVLLDAARRAAHARKRMT